jgi:hypothetical protein
LSSRSRKFIRAVDTIIEKTGAHVTVIHHTPWEQDRAKGAIDLDGAVDASFLVRNNNGRYTLRCDGGNDQEEGLIAAYIMKSVVVGTDENGKVTDAPVVIRDEAAIDSDDGDIKLSSKKPVRAVRLFETAIREKGKENPDKWANCGSQDRFEGNHPPRAKEGFKRHGCFKRVYGSQDHWRYSSKGCGRNR